MDGSAPHADGSAPDGEKTKKDEKDDKKKKKKKLKKGQKKKMADPQNWEVRDIPAMEDRDVVEVTADPEALLQKRQEAIRKIALERGAQQDPATYPRQWKLHFGILGFQNLTASPVECFLAISTMNHEERSEKVIKNIKAKFSFTRAYKANAEETRMFKAEEVVMSKSCDFSYKDCVEKDVVLDMWSISKTGFNLLLGQGAKSYYDIANSDVNEPIGIYDSNSSMIAFVYCKSVLSEIFEFTIHATNWQLTMRPELDMAPGGTKMLDVGVPREHGGGCEKYQTEMTPGPKYVWPQAGVFQYVGTEVGLAFEAIEVTVSSNAGEVGKAILSLAGYRDYPLVQGKVKKTTANASEYVQGQVGGGITITKRSVALTEDQMDNDSTIPPPQQPASQLQTFFLSPKNQYLVVNLFSADSLPIADIDAGSSTPIARVKYDGMVQHSVPIAHTSTPVWNCDFFIPIRVTDESVRTDEGLYERVLPIEMQSKGYLEIEIWHFDSIPTEFMGSCRIDMSRTRAGDPEERAICQKVTKVKDALSAQKSSDEEGDNDLGVDPGLSKKHKTRVLNVRREPIVGSWLATTTKAFLSCDCYFVPDFPDDFLYPPQVVEGTEQVGEFKADFKQWTEHWTLFNEAYYAWFPDAVKGRRFLHKFKAQSIEDQPLVKLITPLALPESLEEPTSLLHWIRCMEFQVPPRQRIVGEFSNWSSCEATLTMGRGTVQDHAVLLASALRGLKKDAFVCKGTVQGGKEHAWVMTREKPKVVTFWETTTGCKYHLDKRWSGDSDHKQSTKVELEEAWKRRKVNAKWMEFAAKRAALNRAQHLHHLDDLAKLPISPWVELCETKMLVCVPYETIEIVFNAEQLWGNLGNAHPACIHYNMEDDPKSWYPLLNEELRETLRKTPNYQIPVGPAITDFSAANISKSMESELKECIRAVRTRLSLETFFMDDFLLHEALVAYIDHMETEIRLDADWAHDIEDRLKEPFGCPSPFNAKEYTTKCKLEWKEHWTRKRELEEQRPSLPVKRNHLMSAIPIHCSSGDIKSIRSYLLNYGPLQEYIKMPLDETVYFVCVKMFPLVNLLASTWVFIGVQLPLPKEIVLALEAEELFHEDEEAKAERKSLRRSMARAKSVRASGMAPPPV